MKLIFDVGLNALFFDADVIWAILLLNVNMYGDVKTSVADHKVMGLLRLRTRGYARALVVHYAFEDNTH